jgi:REP element-mobilizing transposase RayT
MGRELRAIEPDFPYHVISRGNNSGPIVFDAVDVELFIAELGRVATKYDWEVWSWCLMTNHFHVVARTPEGALSLGMQELNGNHGRRTNHRHSRSGHLVENRFFSVAVDSDAYAVSSNIYVVRNPVKAGLCMTPADWSACSYRATVGLEPAPRWLAVDAVLGLFGKDRERAVRAYRDYVHSGQLPVSDTIEQLSRYEPPPPQAPPRRLRAA